jgi:hypothetical protein
VIIQASDKRRDDLLKHFLGLGNIELAGYFIIEEILLIHQTSYEKKNVNTSP